METGTTTQDVVVPVVPWDEFTKQLRWKQGEHVALIGTTGSGKTHLATWLLPHRQYIVVFATKPRDKTLSAFGKDLGFKVLPKWENLSIKKYPRRTIWPDAKSLNGMEQRQRAVFIDAMNHIYSQGGWTLYMDELWWMDNQLKMRNEIKKYLQQARAMQISLVVASQRPAWIPVEVYDQSTHLFFWRDSDITNLRRMGGIGYTSMKVIMETVANLPQYHCLYMNTRTGKLMITKPPKGGY